MSLVKTFNLPCGLAIQTNVPLAPLTSWLVGGPADFYVQPSDLQGLKEALAWGELLGMPVTILGGGTNILIADAGVRGLTIGLRKLSGTQVSKSVAAADTNGNGNRNEDANSQPSTITIECLAGTAKSELLKIFLKEKLEPALFLAGLPGDVGGGIVMNAGVGEQMKPREFVEITEWVDVLRCDAAASARTPQLAACTWRSAVQQDIKEPSEIQILERALSYKTERFLASELSWNYRHCDGWQPGIVVKVSLVWPLEPSPDILARVKQANLVRLSKQPLDQPSCGSVFRNPDGHKAGQLIQELGLKGFTIGGAQVSTKHANFIVNTGTARALEIHQVIEHVKAEVQSKAQVAIKTEVVYIGEWHDSPSRN
jgi:UDP-N-acetylmuramate dehydrogenase